MGAATTFHAEDAFGQPEGAEAAENAAVPAGGGPMAAAHLQLFSPR